MNLNKYKFINVIGSGTFGTVYKVSNDNKIYAEKIITLWNNDEKHDYDEILSTHALNEINFISTFKNIKEFVHVNEIILCNNKNITQIENTTQDIDDFIKLGELNVIFENNTNNIRIIMDSCDGDLITAPLNLDKYEMICKNIYILFTSMLKCLSVLEM